MCDTYRGNKRRRIEGGSDEGFTLVELLIVIFVLGVLAAVVIFALGGITSKGVVSACQADGATVLTAVAAFDQQNPTLTAAVSSASLTDTATTYSGPYLQSWPSNGTHYAYSLASGVLKVAIPSTGTATTYSVAVCTTAT